jgi:pilus assembly protein Flp/PilA
VDSSVALRIHFSVVGPVEEVSMARLGRFLVEFHQREDGPTAVEYAVMLALIIVLCLAGIATLGSNANEVFANVALNAAASGS